MNSLPANVVMVMKHFNAAREAGGVTMSQAGGGRRTQGSLSIRN